MSRHGWSSYALVYIGDDCGRIYGYNDRAPQNLKLLLNKYGSLGQQLHDLSGLLERSSSYYHDPELEKHIHNAKIDLERHFTASNEPVTALARFLPKRSPKNELSQERISELHLEVDEHCETAKTFRIDFLLNYGYPQLQCLLDKLRQYRDGAGGELRTTAPTLTDLNEQDLVNHNAQQNPSTLLPNGSHQDDTVSIVTNATGAFKLARVVWAASADKAQQYRRRSRNDASSSSGAPTTPREQHMFAKQKFVNDVVALIEETRLYAEDISMGATIPRDILDKLMGIVSKATELKKTLPSPEINALQNSTRPSPRPTRRQDRSGQPAISRERAGEIPQLPVPPHEGSSSSSPQTPGSQRDLAQRELPAIPSQPVPPRIGTVDIPVEAFRESISVGGSSQEPGPLGPAIGPEFPTIGPPALSSSNTSTSIITNNDENEGLSPLGSAVSRGKRPEKPDTSPSWTKISSLQAGLNGFCTLEIVEGSGGICVTAIVTPVFMSSPSIEGSVQQGLIGSPSMSSNGRSNGNHNGSYARTFKHLFRPDARPIPSVKPPHHEGPRLAPESPYAITFTEDQLFGEHTTKACLEPVGDLKYIFSHKAGRDVMRSRLFGKKLLLSVGVRKIEFKYIACELQAVSLWEDTTYKYGTITFMQKSKDRRSPPGGEAEFEIVCMAKYKDALDNSRPLILNVRQVAGPGAREKVSERKDCKLFFHDGASKKAFIDELEEPQPPGPGG